jgi:hypothetical protein
MCLNERRFCVCGYSLLLITPGELVAQWGAIQQGVDAARGARKATEPAKEPPWGFIIWK